MHIGLVGLGKMGANMRLRLRERGVEVTGFDPNPEVSDAVDLPALVAALPGGRRVVWVMVPAGAPTRDVVSELGGLLGEGDVVAEGYELLVAQDLVTDVTGTLKAWTRGTVVRSWLLDLLVAALEEDPELGSIDDWGEDSGEGRWTVDEAIDQAVPVPVISAALFARFASRQVGSPAMKAVAALRRQFGGHAVRPAKQ